MKVQWGSFQHDDNECWFSLSKVVKRGQTGERMSFVERWTIYGVRKADTVSDLTTAIDELVDAYSNDYRDLTFLDNSGNATSHSIANADTVNGTQVKRLDFLDGNPGIWGSGTEYVNRRTYRIVIEAEVVELFAGTVQWQETVRQIGNGGAEFVMMGALTGPVQRQQVQQFTPFKLIQAGRAVGYLDWPAAPSPLYPGALHPTQYEPVLEGPLRVGHVQSTHWPIRWKYVMESAAALTGGPNLF